MSFDPRVGYGHMEKWYNQNEEWIGSYEVINYPFQEHNWCPKCGGKTDWWEGQTGEEWDGSAIYEGCDRCYKCDIHNQWWSIDG